MWRQRRNRTYYGIIALCLFVQLCCWVLMHRTEWVERYYANGFYPVYAYFPKLLFGWLPFSVGDLVYVCVALLLLYLLILLVRQLVVRRWADVFHTGLKATAVILILYNLFYVSWGLNYFRQPLAVQYGLDTESVEQADFYRLLEQFIARANTLRPTLDLADVSRSDVRRDLEELMRSDTTFDGMLSKSHIRGKAPVSSVLSSYFMVTGYFNPFTHEVQVNQLVPLAAYPFTTVHELAHQMGIGFEDECNFIAYQLLINHPNPWYAYSAYYEAIQYFLRPVRVWDSERFDAYYESLHPLIKEDLIKEREFWMQYSGWIDRVSGAFYDVFLQHNNQPEGSIRYSMMSRLVIAWDKKYSDSE